MDGDTKSIERGKEILTGGSVMKMEERWGKEKRDGGEECERWMGMLRI